MITGEKIEETTSELLRKAVTDLPGDVVSAIRKAYKKESSEVARTQLEAILENIGYAQKNKSPICQDTGIPVVYIGLGSKAPVDPGIIGDAVAAGVRRASQDIPLRSNTVHPLTRKNSGDNTGKASQ